MTVPLGRIAHARSGDKGDVSNIGVIARSPVWYAAILREVTPARVKDFFGPVCRGRVERFELPHVCAVNLLLHQALAGGGTVSLRVDAQGKTLGAALLALPVHLDEHEHAALRD